MEGRGWVETDVTGMVYGLGVHSLLFTELKTVAADIT